MGLPITLRGPAAREQHADQVVHGLHAELRRVDRIFSTYRAGSEISLLRAGALPTELASTDVQEVLALCEQARVLTGGHFDAGLPQPDGRRVLDPSGLVKGWAVERAARALDALDGHDWIVNASGTSLPARPTDPRGKSGSRTRATAAASCASYPCAAVLWRPPGRQRAASTSWTHARVVRRSRTCSAPPSSDPLSPGPTSSPPPPSAKAPQRTTGSAP